MSRVVFLPFLKVDVTEYRPSSNLTKFILKGPEKVTKHQQGPIYSNMKNHVHSKNHNSALGVFLLFLICICLEQIGNMNKFINSLRNLTFN